MINLINLKKLLIVKNVKCLIIKEEKVFLIPANAEKKLIEIFVCLFSNPKTKNIPIREIKKTMIRIIKILKNKMMGNFVKST